MAPSRRRGGGGGRASSVAAAVAAASRWKVGDLVLAKVKGFPAWPAIVSEPEKWGHSNDWKKVLVFFFGTKQIAFCNPADVEAFTEEKKKSLLVKRQGRGADYARALQEIIVCFDKLKDQGRKDEEHSSDGGDILCQTNPDDSVAKTSEICQIQSPKVLKLAKMYEDAEICETRDAVEDLEAMKNLMETTHEISAVGADRLDTYIETISAPLNTARNPNGSSPGSFDILKQVPFRKSRNTSSKTDPCQFQSEYKKTVDDVPYEPAKRSLRARKASAAPELLDMDSSPGISGTFTSGTFTSNDSSEDNGSGILATNCVTFTLDDSYTYKSEQPETDFVSLKRGSQLTDRLCFESKSVVLKRKRKPNRKPVVHDAEMIVSSPAKETDIEVAVSEFKQNNPSLCDKVPKCFPKADGDEHLPLVKRARVRMSKPLLQDEEQKSFVGVEDKSLMEAPLNHLLSVSSSFSPTDNIDKASMVVPDAANVLSPSNGCTYDVSKEPLFSKANKFQMRGCSVDCEAALPPSKRLHRALEAMSANRAAESRRDNEDKYSSKEMCSNGCSDSSEKCSSSTAMGNAVESSLEVKNMNSVKNGPSLNDTSGSSPSLPSPSSELSEKSTSTATPHGIYGRNSHVPKHEDCKDILNQDKNLEGLKVGSNTSLDNTPGASEVKLEGHMRPSSYLDEKQTADDYFNQANFVKPNKHGILGVVDRRCELIRDHSALSSSHKRVDSVSGGKGGASITATNMLLSDANQPSSKNAKALKCSSDDEVKGISQVFKEANHKVVQVDRTIPSNTSSLKSLIAAANAKRHLSQGASLCEPILDDMSPSLFQREDSYEQASSPSSIICHSSTVDSTGYLLQSSVGSPDTFQHHKKATTALDINVANMEPSLSYKREAIVAKKSFESMLSTLTRTKESIARATRLAIDCSKFGAAGEVMEIIVRNLERELSMHKKVDLFFLVDSILQCSRSHKGDMYSSAVQSVLPRLLSAAAPPGNAARENRKQCIKVLGLWLERKTLSESVLRHHIKELDSITDASFGNAFSRRLLRTERALDDPIREMEGMLVDEYGSNASFQISGFSMPRMLEEEEGSDTDDKSFEAVTPEHDPEVSSEQEVVATLTTEKRRHILEDVDGELEMEDVAPSIELDSVTVHKAPVCHHERHPSQLLLDPPLPEYRPPSPPPLPTSPPPTAQPLASLLRPSSDINPSRVYLTTNGMPSTNLGTSDTAHYHASQYGDFAVAQRPGPSTQSDISGTRPGSHLIMNSSSNTCHPDDVRAYQKSQPLQPPHASNSSQFSYVQSNQRMQAWTEASSSSSYNKRSQYGHEVRRHNTYDNCERADLVAEEFEDSHRNFSERPRSGPHHLVHRETFRPASYYGPPRAPTGMLNRGLSFPPKASHFGHPSPRRPPECTFYRSRAPNLWRPR